MRAQLMEANKNIESLLGVKSEVFAYPCGNTFVGRGRDTKSYVPVVAELFLLGRGWLDEDRMILPSAILLNSQDGNGWKGL